MAYPSSSQIEVALLCEIQALGGSVRPKDVYHRVAAQFPDLTDQDLNRKMESRARANKWNNLVQWARQSCVVNGEIDGSVRGVWTITEKGIARLEADGPTSQPEAAPPTATQSLRDLVLQHEEETRQALAQRLSDMAPDEFEQFSKQLLEALGFDDMVVTQTTADGGIDGYGRLRMGVVRISAAFQSKRWSNPVGRPEIQRFRGAISGEYDQGIFVTTSTFSKQAQEDSVKKGTVPIMLIDVDEIISMMIRHEIGVKKKAISLFEIDGEFFED